MPSTVPTLSDGALIAVVAVGSLTVPARRASISAPPLTAVGSSDPRGRPVNASIARRQPPDVGRGPLDGAFEPAIARDGDSAVDLAARHGKPYELRIDAAAVSFRHYAAADGHRRSRHLRRRGAQGGVGRALRLQVFEPGPLRLQLAVHSRRCNVGESECAHDRARVHVADVRLNTRLLAAIRGDISGAADAAPGSADLQRRDVGLSSGEVVRRVRIELNVTEVAELERRAGDVCVDRRRRQWSFRRRVDSDVATDGFFDPRQRRRRATHRWTISL